MPRIPRTRGIADFALALAEDAARKDARLRSTTPSPVRRLASTALSPRNPENLKRRLIVDYRDNSDGQEHYPVVDLPIYAGVSSSDVLDLDGDLDEPSPEPFGGTNDSNDDGMDFMVS